MALMLGLALCPLLLPKIWHAFEKPILVAIGIWTLIVMVQAEGTNTLHFWLYCLHFS
jgi:hypothetical protein